MTSCDIKGVCKMARAKNNAMSLAIKMFVAILVIGLIVVIAAGIYIFVQLQNTASKMYDSSFDSITSEYRDVEVSLSEGDAISVAIFGTDSDADRDLQLRGDRSDTIIIVTLNPETDTGTIMSIPRDTQTTISGIGSVEKINHAHSYGGPTMARDTVENFLEVPIDYFVSVDMDGFMNIVDELGGVTVKSNDTFSIQNYHFQANQTYTMSGEEALMYSRARKSAGSGGDFGRQARQQQIIQAMGNEIVGMNTITNFNRILEVLGNNISTNVQFSEIYDLSSKYQKAANSLERIELEGDGGIQGDGLWYFTPYSDSLENARAVMKENLNLN